MQAIIAFIIFLLVAGAVGYFVWKKSALKSDLKDDGIIK